MLPTMTLRKPPRDLLSKFNRGRPPVLHKSKVEEGKYGEPHVVRQYWHAGHSRFEYMVPFILTDEDSGDENCLVWVNSVGETSFTRYDSLDDYEIRDWASLEDLSAQEAEFLCGEPPPSIDTWSKVRE